LDSALSSQRYAKDRSGLGYSKFENSRQNQKSISVKSSNAYNNVQPRKVRIILNQRRLILRISSILTGETYLITN